ncbi:hypothetical protein CLIM01_08343 [Colletotrichum limetticola]|uniref:Uncharacterized protein n=1 Tax=Colletotrichum limetticola TaxID=1209924 RepID=A0ABQ9PRV4_9PEZI|nr:hypothetical protein CLIM01_08343 [Colletotrichum limetticola]
MSTTSNAIPTLISQETTTITFCTFGTAAAVAVTRTITETSTDWSGNDGPKLGYSPNVLVSQVEAFVDNCTRYLDCEMTVYPNPDISGNGVLTAFVVSAYLVFALIVWAYWFGALPKGLARNIDRRLFFARPEQSEDRWRKMFVELVLMLSDQQLLTGLTILIAGYTQALGANLSAYHWNAVVYLAWLSSTVHLMSLSVLRDRLRASRALRSIRVSAIILILGLLLVALVPTVSSKWRSMQPGLPVRCFWDTRTYGSKKHRDSWISYVSLIGAFAWKLCQFFDSSRDWVRFWGRSQLEYFLEMAAKRTLQKPPGWRKRALYKAIISIYIVSVAWLELLESFMLTLFLLAFTLAWGTFQLFSSKSQVGKEIRSAEREMGFGQLLPVLLLSQPVFVALQLYLGKRETCRTENKARVLSQTKVCTDFSIKEQRVPQIPPSSAIVSVGSFAIHPRQAALTAATKLSDVLQNDRGLLSASEKAAGQLHDPVIGHLYQSKTFLRLIIYMSVTSLAPVVLPFVLPANRSLGIAFTIPPVVFLPLVVFPMYFHPKSNRLR